MENKIKLLSEQIEEFVIEGKESLEKFRIQYLGSKNVLKDLFTEIKTVPSENRKTVGQLINGIKNQALIELLDNKGQTAINKKKIKNKIPKLLSEDFFINYFLNL